jgi:RNA polymerase sigma-70 factor (ECF subfamily)
MSDEDIYNRHFKKVYGFFMAKTFNRYLAEDLTSDVFTTAFEQFQNSSKQIIDKEKYLYGVMKLTWLTYLRQKYANLESSDENIEDYAVYAEQTIEETCAKSLIDRALPYIEQLPDRQRDIMLLRFRDGLSLKQICQQTGKDMNYVKTTQRRGLASLKRVVER